MTVPRLARPSCSSRPHGLESRWASSDRYPQLAYLAAAGLMAMVGWPLRWAAASPCKTHAGWLLAHRCCRFGRCGGLLLCLCCSELGEFPLKLGNALLSSGLSGLGFGLLLLARATSFWPVPPIIPRMQKIIITGQASTAR